MPSHLIVSLCSTIVLSGSRKVLSFLSFIAVKCISSVLATSNVIASSLPLENSKATSRCSTLMFFLSEVEEVARDRSSMYESLKLSSPGNRSLM
jgi:hypothetical protein